MGLLFLYALAWRRDVLRRPTRMALGQIALALYLPPAVGLFWVPFDFWDDYLAQFSLMPTFIPAALITGSDLVFQTANLEPGTGVAMVVLSLSPLVVTGVLGVVARRGTAWRIACLIVALGMSALSTLVDIVMHSIPT